MSHVDGNAIAGQLSEVFAGDLASAVATCAGCGTVGPLASVMVYEGMGEVLRCPSCDDVLVRFMRVGTDACLDMRGVTLLRWRTGA